jgi:glyceraldehyde 3-phosphate dehydrogenase
MTKIAINGLGRIGRPSLKIALEKPNLEVVAINDLTDPETLAYLIKYDSLYGIYEKQVETLEAKESKDKEVGYLVIEGKKIAIFAEKDPENLPWKNLGIDIVLECTGFFTEREGAEKHLKAGAKKVIISAPSKSEEVPTFVLGVNEEKYNPQKDDIISNTSCTTNCLAPVVKVLDDHFKIEKGFLTTVHSYTNDQRILDLPHKDLRRGRAAALSIIPTTTGAARDVMKVIPQLEGRLDGISLRVPTPTVSIVDFIATLSQKTSVEEVNKVFLKEAQSKLKGILACSDEPLVSVDYRKSPYSAIVDLALTMVKDNLVKVVAWYDNEWGYACRLVEMAEYISSR